MESERPFLARFKDRLKPKVISIFEESASEFFKKLPFGESKLLLDAPDKGMKVYQFESFTPGIVVGLFSRLRKLPTGTPVFFEYTDNTDWYHIVGVVDNNKVFTYTGLNMWSNTERSYERVRLSHHTFILERVTALLPELEALVGQSEIKN